MKLLIQNGRVLDPVSKTVTLTDLLAENGRVALLERGLETEADRIIDASGLVVSPGLVDMHVHLRDPGYTYKEDIRTGTAAAARGGVTSLACMANTDPVLDCPEQLHYVRERAKEGSGVHVYPIAAVSVGLRGEEPTDAEALKKAGAVALSDDGCNVDNANLMRDAMIRAKRQELPVLCHCEDTSMVEGRAVNEGSVSRQLWLEGRPAIAEELEVMRAAMLAEETGARVHICHISTAKAVDIVRRMKEHGVPVTCETCPQYFTLTEDEILTQGSLARINPPLRTQQDVKGIIADCPYSSPKDIIRKVAKDMHMPDRLSWPFVKIGGRVYGGFDVDETDAARAVKQAKVPILIIHGESDSFVPCEMSDIVSENPALITRCTFPGADHGFSYLVDTPRYRKIVTDFVEKALTPKA